ncbi:MAG: amidohydrolase family protein [Treponema sp.]|jgi:5-methylthioadenosine/S-adenosylhomocysteine deaminase|nr:amidohydrolase family protein [Treponema sp.]
MYSLGIENVIIVSGNFGYVPFRGSVYLDGEVIAEVCPQDGSQDVSVPRWIDGVARRIDGGGKILMPGLVNCHCHGDMTLARGLGDDMTLREQIEAFRPHNWFYQFISDDDRYYARQLAYCEALLAGTTFICENMYWGLGERSIGAMTETGIKGALVEDIRHDFSNSDSFVPAQKLKDFSASCRESGLVPVIGLMAEEDFETGRLRKAFDLLQDIDAMQTIHLAENEWRRDLILKQYNMTPVEYLARNGFLNGRLIGSHVVCVTDNEIGLLKEFNVKVANTPLCEMKIADGIAPVPEMVRQAVTVGLGTDGALWNNSNDIFREMKAMSLLHTVSRGIRSLSKKDILNMATTGGAAVFGKEKEFGMIKEGMKADMILIDADKPHMQPLLLGKNENVASALVFSATGADVTDVFVNGKRLVKDGALTDVDVPDIIARVKRAAEKLGSQE